MGNTTKRDIIGRVSRITKYKRHVVGEMIDVFFDVLGTEIQSGNKVTFADFGVFELKEGKPRTIRNPRTNEVIEVPAKRRVCFRPAKRLKEGIKKNG